MWANRMYELQTVLGLERLLKIVFIPWISTTKRVLVSTCCYKALGFITVTTMEYATMLAFISHFRKRSENWNQILIYFPPHCHNNYRIMAYTFKRLGSSEYFWCAIPFSKKEIQIQNCLWQSSRYVRIRWTSRIFLPYLHAFWQPDGLCKLQNPTECTPLLARNQLAYIYWSNRIFKFK